MTNQRLDACCPVTESAVTPQQATPFPGRRPVFVTTSSLLPVFLTLLPVFGIQISQKIIFTGKYRKNLRLRDKLWRDASKKSPPCGRFIQKASLSFANQCYRCYLPTLFLTIVLPVVFVVIWCVSSVASIQRWRFFQPALIYLFWIFKLNQLTEEAARYANPTRFPLDYPFLPLLPIYPSAVNFNPFWVFANSV